LQQTCRVCGRPDKFDFHVPDSLWAVVVPAEYRNRVVCLYCFDEFAHQQGVEYAAGLRTLYFAGKQASLEFRRVEVADGR